MFLHFEGTRKQVQVDEKMFVEFSHIHPWSNCQRRLSSVSIRIHMIKRFQAFEVSKGTGIICVYVLFHYIQYIIHVYIYIGFLSSFIICCLGSLS